MARLERVGDRTELVTDDGIRMPWELGERPEYGLTLPPLGPPPVGPDLRTASNEHTAPARAEVRSDFDPRAAAASMDASEQRDTERKLVEHLSGGSGKEHTARSAPSRLQPDQKFSPKPDEGKTLRGGLREVDAPDVPEEEQPGGGGGYAPVQKIPGGVQLDTVKVEKGSANPEELAGVKQSLEQASKSNREALALDAASQVQQNVAQADILDAQANDQLAKVRSGRQRLQTAMEASDAKKAELDNERDKITNLEKDPYHFWASKNLGTKILAAIGMLSGGLLAGVKGGENQFLKSLQETMAEDKAQRKDRLNARKQGYQLQRDEWDKVHAGLDPDSAEKEWEGRQLAATAGMMRAFGLRTQNPAIIAKMNAEADKYDAEARIRYGKVDQDTGDRITETLKNVPDRYVGGPAKVNESDVQGYADDLEKAGLGASEGSNESIRDLLAQIPEGEIPTLETRDPFSREVLRPLLDWARGEGGASKTLDTPTEQRAVAALQRIKNQKLKELTGAGVSAADAERLARGFAGANTREGLVPLINEADLLIARRKAGIGAGFKREVRQEYERRKREQLPAAKPKSSRGE